MPALTTHSRIARAFLQAMVNTVPASVGMVGRRPTISPPNIICHCTRLGGLDEASYLARGLPAAPENIQHDNIILEKVTCDDLRTGRDHIFDLEDLIFSNLGS